MEIWFIKNIITNDEYHYINMSNYALSFFFFLVIYYPPPHLYIISSYMT